MDESGQKKAITSSRNSSTLNTPKWLRSSRIFHASSEACVYGLNMVKNDLQEMQHPITRRTGELLMCKPETLLAARASSIQVGKSANPDKS